MIFVKRAGLIVCGIRYVVKINTLLITRHFLGRAYGDGNDLNKRKKRDGKLKNSGRKVKSVMQI